MVHLPEQTIYCPYCGEPQIIIVDVTSGDCNYIEDCQICCRPIEFDVSVQGDESFELVVRHENE